MGAFDDYFETAQPSQLAVPQEEGIGDALRKGFNSGVSGAGASLNQLAGLGGEIVGANEFAQGRYAAAKGLRRQAEEEAPEINSLGQIHNVNTALRYGAGQLGAMAPMAGAAVAGGLVTGNPFIGGTLALAPMAAGDIAERQQEDPAVAGLSAGQRGLRAVGGGLAAGAVQNIGPGMFAGKLASKVAGAEVGALAKQSASSIMAKNLAEGVGVNAGGSAGGEAISQYSANPDKSLDTARIGESAATGAVMGLPFGAAGGAAELLKSRVRGGTDALKSGANAVSDAAVQAATEAPKKFKSVSEDIGDLFKRGKEMSGNIVDKVLNGEALVDAKQFATEAGQTFSDNEKVKAATAWTGQMANDAGLTPERRQQAVDLAQNATTEAGQIAAAAAKKTYDMGMTAAVKINNLYDSLADKVNEQVDLFQAGRASGNVKQSADFSGINKAIADQLGPLLDKNPGLADRPGDVAKLADTVRVATEKLPNLRLDSDTMFRLIDTLGDQTASTLSKAYRTIKSDDPVAAETFFKKLNEVNDLQKRSAKLKDFVGGALTDEAKAQISPQQYGELANGLLKHARGEFDRPNVGPNELKARNQEFRDMLAEHFGDKADAVSLAIEKEAGIQTKAEKIPDAAGIRREAEDLDGVDHAKRSMGAAFNAETGERLEAGQVDSARFGLTKPDAAGKSKSQLDGAAMPENSQYARQHLLDLKEKYKSPEGEEPRYNVRFEKIEGSNMGHIVVERNGAASEGEFGIGDLERIKLDTHEHGKSPSRIEIGNLKIDAVKIARLAGKRDGFNFESPDTLPSIHRTVDMFKRGIAQLSVQFDQNINVPDSTVIGYSGKRVDTPEGRKFVRSPVTWGDAQKLSRATADDKAADRSAQRLTELRQQYLQATASPEKLAKLGLEQKKLSPEGMAALVKAAQDHAKDADYAKNRELAGESSGSPREAAMRRLEADHEHHLNAIENKGVPRDEIKTTTSMGDRPFEERNGNFDENGRLTKAGAIDLLQGSADGGINVKDQEVRGREQRSFAAENKPVLPEDPSPNSSARRKERNRQQAGYDRSPMMYSEGEGRTAIGKDEQISRVATTLSEKDMVNKSNMDGSAQHVPDKKSGINLKPIINIANELKAGEFTSAGSIKIGNRLSTLIENRGLMRESDVAKLQTITTDMSAHEVGKIINPLAEKYKNVILDTKSPMAENGSKPADKGAVSQDTGRPVGSDPGAVKRLNLSEESRFEVWRRMNEGPSDPKSPAAKKAAATFGDAGAVAEEGGTSRVATPIQQNSMARSIDRIRGPFEHLIQGVKFVAEEGPHRGMTHVDDGMVGVNFKALRDDSRWAEGMTAAQRLDWVMAHELGHVHDVFQGGETSLLTSREIAALDVGGWAYKEAEAARSKSPLLDWVYKYPLEDSGNNHARELYAQNFALFNHNPELMREHLPKTYEAISRLASGGAEARALDAFADSSQGKNSQGESVYRNDGAGKTQKEIVAEKKAAILEAAKANDPALIKELSTTDNAAGLQRSVDFLVMHLSKADFTQFEIGGSKGFGGLHGDAGYFTTNDGTISKYRAMFGNGNKYTTKLKLSADDIFDATKTLAEQTPAVQDKMRALVEKLSAKEKKNPDGVLNWVSQALQADLKFEGAREEWLKLGIKAMHHAETGATEGSYAVFDKSVIGPMVKMGIGETLAAANKRMGELVQDPDTAMNLTKKYSMDGTRIHEESGNEGFGATHDSPTRHEGNFDWRSHQGKGEGNASFGAGTYLSTADGVHKSYKNDFTAVTANEKETKLTSANREYVKREEAVKNAEVQIALAKKQLKNNSDSEFYKTHLATYERGAAINRAWLNSNKEAKVGGVFRDDNSPTYEVSVNIKPEQLLDWDKPLSQQSERIQEALRKPDIPVPTTADFFDGYLGGKREGVATTPDGDEYTIKYEPTTGEYVVKDEKGKQLSKRKAEELAQELDAGGFLSAPSVLDLDPRNSLYASQDGSGIYKTLVSALGSQTKASEYLQSLGILGHKYAASGGKNDAHPNYVIFDDSKIKTNYVHFDKSESGSTKTDIPTTRQAVADYITKVLGDSVKLKFAALAHAGDFERMRLHDLIRLSTTALDPMSTAHHEALHAFFAQLKDAGAHDITNVLEKAAGTDHVIRQLNEIYKGNDAVLAQLKDPEERAAYMYQHWAAGDLKIGPHTKNVFTRIADFIRGVMGVWTNDQRATMILEHFNSGEYANSGRDASVLSRNVTQKGRNQALEAAKSFVEPLARLADAVVGTGSGRLRDMDSAAIRDIADLVKRDHLDDKGGDRGFIPTTRVETAKRIGELADKLSAFSQDQLHEAMEALQRGRDYSGADGAKIRQAQKIVKDTLQDTLKYMKAAGIEMGDLGPDYFPRVWDNHYISKNQQAFKDMLEPYIRRGEFKGNADELIRTLATRDGNEFGIDRKKLNFDDVKAQAPGMQFSKKRLLDFIKPEDAAMFVNKDLIGTMSTYLTQAVRKTEWTRRFGDGKLEEKLDQARREGVTPDQLKTVDSYLRGVDGTLGDSINPHARRIMGNMIVYQNIRLLPFAAFSSIVDPAGVLVRGGTIKDAWKTFTRGISEIPQNFGREGTHDEATKMAELTGVVDRAVLSSTMGDIYTQGMVGGFAKKANNLFFKYNLMEGLNRSFRIGASEAAINFIGHHADGTASTHSQRYINELGLQAGDIKKTADGRIALTEAEGLSKAQEGRVHMAINQWVDGAVLRPDAADKPIYFNDPRFALISHLKQFTYTFQKVIIGRVVHEAQNGNYTPAMALASYVPIMMAADFAKGMIQGGGDQPEWKKGWDMVDYTGYAWQRAGLNGVGQFGVDVAKDVHRGGLGVGALAGPTLEQFGDAVQLLGGHKQFGPMVLNALPANALYAHAFGHSNVPDPMFSE